MSRRSAIWFPKVRSLSVVAALGLGLTVGTPAAFAQLGDDFFDDTPAADAETPDATGDLGPGEGDAERPDAQEILDAGMRLMEEQRWAEAIEKFSQVLAANPRFAPGHLLKGRALMELDEIGLAIKSFQATIDNAPNLLDGYIELGKAQIEAGQFEEAVENFSFAVEQRPVEAEYLFLRGKAFNRMAVQLGAAGGPTTIDHYRSAKSSLDRASKLRADHAETFVELAMANSALGEADDALEASKKAVEIEPNNPQYQARLGFQYVRRGDIEVRGFEPNTTQAIGDFRAGIEALSQFVNVQASGDLPGMEDPTEAIDEDDPMYIKPETGYIGLAAARLSLAQELPAGERSSLYEEAIADCDKALSLDNELPDALYQKGIAQRLKGDLDTAIDTLTKAADLQPGQPSVYLRRGIIYYHQNKLEMAMKDFTMARDMGIARPDGLASFWMGVVKARQGEELEATRLFTQSIRENPGYQLAYSNRGLVYMKIGQYQRAVDDFNHLLLLDRNNSTVRARRDQAARLAGQ